MLHLPRIYVYYKSLSLIFVLISLRSLIFSQNSPNLNILTDTLTNSIRESTPGIRSVSKENILSKTEVPRIQPEIDTSWHPVRRLWGYAFGDFYYVSHADAGNRGPENQYYNVPGSRNAFQFRRLYLGYDYDISRKFIAEVILASEPNANTGVNGTTSIQNGDNTVDGKMAFYIKIANIRYRNIWPGTDLVIGEMLTPGWGLYVGPELHTNAPNSLSENTMGHRFLEKTVADIHKSNPFDLGAALQGTFDPATKKMGYVFMVGNNSQSGLLSAANPNTGFFKIFYGSIWGKFLNNHIYLDLYAEYLKTASSTPSLGAQSHNLVKIFASYNAKPITLGVEAYAQTFKNGLTNSTSGIAENAVTEAISIWAKGPIIKNKLSFFIRRDGYNPDTKFNAGNNYTINTNLNSYTPNYKETFYNGGIDFTPAPKIHFMPNFWLVDYKDQRNSTVSGYVANDHTLAYRFTFFYTFGK